MVMVHGKITVIHGISQLIILFIYFAGIFAGIVRVRMSSNVPTYPELFSFTKMFVNQYFQSQF